MGPNEWQEKNVATSILFSLQTYTLCKPKPKLVFTFLFAFSFWITFIMHKINLLLISTHNSTAVAPASHAGQLMAVKGVGHCHGTAAVTLRNEQKQNLVTFILVTNDCSKYPEQRDVGTIEIWPLAACPCRAKKSKDCSVPLGSWKKESHKKGECINYKQNSKLMPSFISRLYSLQYFYYVPANNFCNYLFPWKFIKLNSIATFFLYN